MIPTGGAPGADAGGPAAGDARAIVLEGYARASHAYRGDEFPLEGSGYEHWLARLESHLAPGSRVLDLGCGNGLPVARALAGRHAVTGVDLSPVQIERARALVPQATFRCADMADVEFDEAAFDAVLAFYSLINLPLAEHAGVLARAARWLAPGGWLLATVGRDPWAGIEENWRGVPGARMYYSQAGLAQYRTWFRDAGLRMDEEGREPRRGNPGYAVLIAQKAG